MVIIKKVVKKGKAYYYLEHSIRVKDKVSKKTKYLGKEIPKDIENQKKAFTFELYKEKWFSEFEKIKKNYSKDQKAMPPSIKRKELENFAIKFTYDTQRIEGSKLTLRETANLLEKGITPTRKPIDDVKEAEAHKIVFYEMLEHKKELSLQIVTYWNKRLLGLTKPLVAGKIRAHQVLISGSKFRPPFPAELDTLLYEFFSWYKKNRDEINPIELAALVHLKFVTIHPFGDGNGRISRLIMNFVLHKHHYPMLDIPYEKRDSYYTALERSQVKGDDAPFLHWFFKRYLKENGRYLNL